MPSLEHKVLRARINELSSRFVDFDIPLDRDPTSHELDMIASFKLLAHAEFETFIEARIQEALRQGIEVWKIDRQVTKAVFGVLLRWYPWYEQDKNQYATPQPLQKVTDLLEVLSRKASREVDDNNGIKREGFSRLCYSTGVLNDDLSPTLLAALESYGKLRGDVAHNAIGKVKTLNDPRVEANDAKQLVELLQQFDTLLGELNFQRFPPPYRIRHVYERLKDEFSNSSDINIRIETVLTEEEAAHFPLQQYDSCRVWVRRGDLSVNVHGIIPEDQPYFYRAVTYKGDSPVDLINANMRDVENIIHYVLAKF